MKKIAKKYFIPHEENRYHPHLFRNISVTAILLASFFLLGVSYGNSFFLQKTILGANISTNVLVDLANVNRTENNAPLLRRNTELDAAAKMKASDMTQRNYFAHFAPDGTTPWYFMRQAGYDFVYAGENLAINYTAAQEIDTAWMNSPTHRQNLLNKNFKEVGIATENGQYEGKETVYVVQMFGSEKETPAILKEPQDTEVKLSVEPSYKTTQQSGVSKNTVSDKLTTTKNTTTKNTAKPDQDVAVQIINQDKDFISVKITDTIDVSSTTPLAIIDVPGTVAGATTYSRWYERALFNSSLYVQIILCILVLLITIGLVFRICIEYKKQEFKQIFFSAIFLCAVIVITLVNYKFIFHF
jgi:uncharacterized protein YkwD